MERNIERPLRVVRFTAIFRSGGVARGEPFCQTQVAVREKIGIFMAAGDGPECIFDHPHLSWVADPARLAKFTGDVGGSQLADANADETLPFCRPVCFVGWRKVHGCEWSMRVCQPLAFCKEHAGKPALQLRAHSIVIARARHVTPVGMSQTLLNKCGPGQQSIQ